MHTSDIPFEAVNQAGVFTRCQAYADGWTPRQVRRRLTFARWKVVVGAALAASDTAIGPHQLAYAVLLTWPDATPSHQLAGQLHGFPVDARGVGTAIVPLAQSRRAVGLRAYRLPLPAPEIGMLGGIPVTTERRTALDLLRHLPWDEARSLWAWLVTRDRLAVPDLEAELAATSGRSGSTQLRRLISASATGSLSAAEDRLHILLTTAGITGWRANARITVDGRTIAVVDILFATERLVVEVDGYSTHSGRNAFQRDRSTQNALVAAGYTVLRFTWADLTERPHSAIAAIRGALAEAAERNVGG